MEVALRRARLPLALLACAALAGGGCDGGTATPPPGDDNGGGGGGGGNPDLATSFTPPDFSGITGPVPISGAVGPTGGTVTRLFFGFLGDARPSQCNEHRDYPSAILDSIFGRLSTANVQFALDLGDHMFVCQGGAQSEADAQMGLYMASAQKLGGGKTTFLTMGNHDCVSMNNPGYCGVSGFTTPNFKAFMNAMASENLGSLPYYSFDVWTIAGLARFIVIADNAWGPVQSAWLSATLADADANARYIFIARHHPLDNTDMPAFATISAMIRNVKHRTMTIEGHTHEFEVDARNDGSGRTIIIGNGGAPLATGFKWYGYGTVEQLDSGNLTVTLYDQASGNKMAAFTLTPQ
jgi:hypothetical protein